MNIYLIRHGEKLDGDRNHGLIGLTEKGFRQADLVGRRLKKYKIDRIYASDMIRAIQTAECINRYVDREIIVRPDLREIHMGACETEGWKYLADKYPDFITEYEKYEADLKYPPDGECGADVWARASKVLEEIAGCGADNVAVVTHGGVIKVLICGILGLDLARRFYMGEPLMNCSISILKYNDRINKFFLHCYNDHAHLE